MKRVVVLETSYCTAPEIQRELPLTGGEAAPGFSEEDAPVNDVVTMEDVVDRANLFRALRKVHSNKGCAGIDGMTVDDLPTFLKQHWLGLRAQLLEGTYRPQPVKQVVIPKPGGGERKLGIPTVVDRFIQQALLQVLQPKWDRTFSHFSFGFRPNRSAHQAVQLSQHYVRAGHEWVVDMDLEKFFDRVNHDVLMSKIKSRESDKRILRLINRFLKAGALSGDGKWWEAAEGTPQGGPLSPLLANLLLDDLDKELERRGHAFARYADDCNIYVKSERAGRRVLSSITRWLKTKLRLTVNEQKSAVDQPWNRSFLGFTFARKKWAHRIKVSEKSLKQLKYRVRQITRRTRGRSISHILKDLRRYLLGWRAYFGLAEVKSPLVDLEKWIRRKLRCYIWKQWGRSGYRQLRRRGVDRFLAWNTAKSAHGPWRLSGSPALYIALPNSLFKKLGLPELARCQ